MFSFYGSHLMEIYMFSFYGSHLIEIYMVLFHGNLYGFISCGNERIFHRVTQYNRKSEFLGKADSLLFKPQSATAVA